MRKVLLLLIPFWLAPLLAQSTANEKVLQSVRQMIESEGTVIFSELYNDDRFNSDEKAFLGRLYEIFFQIPVFIKSEYEGTGRSRPGATSLPVLASALKPWSCC